MQHKKTVWELNIHAGSFQLITRYMKFEKETLRVVMKKGNTHTHHFIFDRMFENKQLYSHKASIRFFLLIFSLLAQLRNKGAN